MALARWAGRLHRRFSRRRRIFTTARAPSTTLRHSRRFASACFTLRTAAGRRLCPLPRSPAIAGADETSALVLAMRFASELLFKLQKPSPSAPIFVRRHRRWSPGPHDLRFKPRCKKEKESGTPKDADPYPPQPFGCGSPFAKGARLSAFHHGSCLRDYSSQRLTSGQAWCGTAP
jgi:hypothetical protein